MYRFPKFFLYIILAGSAIFIIYSLTFTISFNSTGIASWDSQLDRRFLMSPQPAVMYWNRNDSPDKFCVWFNFVKASKSADDSSITLCTHGSIGYSKFIFDHAAHWSDLISVSLIMDESGFDALRAFQKLHRCIPEASNKVSAHLVWRIEDESACSAAYILQGLSNLLDDPDPSNCNLEDHINQGFFEHSLSSPYPPNSLRNIARKGSSTELQLIADIENHFSFNASEVLSGSANVIRENQKVAVIVRRFEYNDTLEEPRTVEELQELMQEHQAFEFHHFLYAKGHHVPGLKQWFNHSLTANSTPILTPVNYQGNAWEPQLVVHADYPYHFEGFPIRFHDQQALPYELCRAGYDFSVTSHAFSFHKGIKRAPTVKESSARRTASSLGASTSKKFREYLNDKYPKAQPICKNWS